MSAVIIHFVGRDSRADPDLAGGCLQDVQFPDASLYENSYVASIPSRHTRFMQCLAQNSKSYQNLNVLESALQM